MRKEANGQEVSRQRTIVAMLEESPTKATQPDDIDQTNGNCVLKTVILDPVFPFEREINSSQNAERRKQSYRSPWELRLFVLHQAG